MMGSTNAACAQNKRLWLYVDEIAHRTMNDYAFMLTTIERATRGLTDATCCDALNRVQGRLRAGAMTYRALHRPCAKGARRLDEELERLCAALSNSVLTERSVTLTLSCAPIELSARRAWQVSLVVAELIANAAKHAFRDGRAGEIWIDVQTVEGILRCAVSDNGAGADKAIRGRGSDIIDALADALDGVLCREHARTGTVAVLICPAEGGEGD